MSRKDYNRESMLELWKPWWERIDTISSAPETPHSWMFRLIVQRVGLHRRTYQRKRKKNSAFTIKKKGIKSLPLAERRKDKSKRWWYWSGILTWKSFFLGLDIDLNKSVYWSGLNKVSCLRRGCRSSCWLRRKIDTYWLYLFWELPNSYWLRWFIDWLTS